MEKVFDDILDKNEKIISVYKPNKTKLYIGTIFIYLFATIWFYLPALLGIIFAQDDSGVPVLAQKDVLWLSLLVTGIYLATFLIVILFAKIHYKNLYFAYSNKRIIIRKGIIGVDYKSLDMAMIGAVNVNVSVLDKILRKNTGTITFGSMASPFAAANAGGSGLYRFSNVEIPYEKYREVKSVIDEYKETRNKNI